MSYFKDLSKYTYISMPKKHLTYLNVGWLSKKKKFPLGQISSSLLKKLKLLANTNRVLESRGLYECELCVSPNTIDNFVEVFHRPTSSAQIHLEYRGVVYCSPEMIVHYIEDHNYLPPKIYLNALRNIELKKL